ncbi:hypothetical protein LTR10_002971 [Elasticomyces elasticus]|nr:hypothetical protein LTR10_002971 [Elasticomyces elasticus]KAK4967691.1 hypothetical protein LTR42_010016 [Elasticomyces elasticus]
MSSSSGLNAHIFRPPLTPPTSNSTDYFSSRKRPRQPTWTRTETTDVRSTLHQTPGWQLASQSQCPTPGYSINERYTLAGGMDTPGLLAQTEAEQGDTYNDGRSRRDDNAAAAYNGRDIVTGPLARERNGVARLPHPPSSPSSAANREAGRSWTGLAFTLVGKVFTFGTSVVKGFYAGGGTGYDLNLNLKDSPLRGILMSREVVGTPVPGSWQEDGEFLGDFEQDNTMAAVGGGQRPGNKRRQTGEGSWVMVGTPDLEGEVGIETSPRRKGAGSSTRIARPSASRASSRRSLAPLPRRGSSYTNAGAGYSAGSPVPTAQGVMGAQERRASVAPTRTHSRHGSLSNNNHNNNSRPSSAAGNHNPSYSTSTLHSRPSSTAAAHHSPRNSMSAANRLNGIVSPGMVYVSPEAEKILRRREKHERKADAAMSDMSRKLGDLIREGREALGTKIDVEGDGDGDDW